MMLQELAESGKVGLLLERALSDPTIGVGGRVDCQWRVLQWKAGAGRMVVVFVEKGTKLGESVDCKTRVAFEEAEAAWLQDEGWHQLMECVCGRMPRETWHVPVEVGEVVMLERFLRVDP